ncbi:phosphatase PAP2 family protein [Streptomyces sp. NPDC008150]|uniref:phosphatase PAP2 family protein n=1 Tax=Streptomyces sp. NPDC008150 TaxID=3364816 RepID=UPI0036EE1983
MRRRTVVEFAGSAALGLWAAFTVLTLAVVGRGGAPLFPDRALLSWSLGHHPGAAQTLARGITYTGTGAVPYVLVALSGLSVGRTRRQRLTAAALWLSCLCACQALRLAVMSLVARARPPMGSWATHASGWSFPSGHTTTSAATAGLVVVAACLRSPRGRGPVCVLAGVWGVLVGLTRVYLRVHWFSDVIGGWLFAGAWLATCLCVAARCLPAGAVRDREADPADSGARPG